MARRLPSEPPVLPGFSYIHVLGSGGFADVFLYEQNMPRRQVAVKVLLSEVVNDQVRQMFQAEANLMAQLSAHPSILTVYQASVSSDGRPYLVMEMCSSGLGDRYRRERVPVAEVLHIAVKIGSAIETAHRAGVLHRDIKPSNILQTAYGHPVLSGLRRRRHTERSRLPGGGWDVDPVVRPRGAHGRNRRLCCVRGLVVGRDRLLAARRAITVRGARPIKQVDRPDLAHQPREDPAHRPFGCAAEPRARTAARHVPQAGEPPSHGTGAGA